MKRKNIILMTDSYKLGGHWNMLPQNVSKVYSYGCARKGSKYKKILVYGNQGIIKAFLVGQVVTQEDIEEAKMITGFHLGSSDYLNIAGWQLIVDEFGGKLPLSIKSVREGEMVGEGNVIFTIENTDERFPWLTNYIEGILMKLYYPFIIATRSKNTVDIVKKYFAMTSDLPLEIANFLVHDFGYRSAPSEDAAEIGCSAHLVNSLGTDSVVALKYAHEFYGANYATLGFSVPASEHSIATARGRAGEKDYIIDLINKYPFGILSLVMDSYDTTNFMVYIEELKDVILERHRKGVEAGFPLTRVVVRPDSPRYEGEAPWEQCLWLHNRLEEIFGVTVNSKGYKVLNPAVGVIYGDGLSSEQIEDIYRKLAEASYSVENMVVGQGGGLIMRDIDRDTIRFAIKCSAQKQDGKWVKIQKNPSDQSKKSLAGRMKLVKMQVSQPGEEFKWEYQTVTEDHPLYYDFKDELIEIFRNGVLLVEQTFDEIRARANQ